MRRATAGRGTSPVMIGREDELRRLAQLVAMPTTGVAMLAGEPGIGKTRLVQELISGLPAETITVLGQAEPGSLGRPFELLLSALDAHGDVDRHHLDLLSDTSRSQVERLRVGLDVLMDITAGGPAVIVFEDLHWADSESIALFERIADLEGNRLLIGTYRPAEVMRRNPIAGLLDRLERRHSVYHVRLERLDLSSTSAFLTAATGKPPPYRAAVSLHNRTGGNPFFLEELLRGGQDLEKLDDQPLPWSLAETLRRQVDHIDPPLQRLVEAAAMLGHKVPFDLLAAVSDRDEADLIWALRELVGQGVLVETGEDEFAFRHALVREAVTERLLGRERRRLHERALNALLAVGDADLALVAKHACGAGRYDDMLAAARQGSVSYLEIGSAFQALQLAEMGLDEVADDPALLATAARAAWLAGLIDDAVCYARDWRANARTSDDDVEALALLVRLAWEVQDLDRMSDLSAELESVQEKLPRERQAARAMAMLAQSARLRDLDDESLRWSTATVDLTATVDGLDDIRLAALLEKGALLAQRAETVDEGRLLLGEVADEAERQGDWLLAATALNRLIHLPPAGTWQELAGLLERMRAAAERAGSEALTVAAYYQGQARLHMRKGKLAGAIKAIERGRLHDLGYRRTATPSDTHGMFLAGLRLEAADVAGAAQIAADIANVAGGDLTSLRFHIACRSHDLTEARALLPVVINVVQSTGGRGGEFFHDLVSAAIEAPLRPDEVDHLAEGLDGSPVDPGHRWLVCGQRADLRGDFAPALKHFLAAIKAGLPPAARGTAHVGAARALIGLHRLEEARAHALTASDLLQWWGGWRGEQERAVRSRLGLSTEDSTELSGNVALTPREREVAKLIAEGLTNAELASRLYISPRTAAVHVSSILRKLGVTSRTEVSAAIAVV